MNKKMNILQKLKNPDDIRALWYLVSLMLVIIFLILIVIYPTSLLVASLTVFSAFSFIASSIDIWINL